MGWDTLSPGGKSQFTAATLGHGLGYILATAWLGAAPFVVYYVVKDPQLLGEPVAYIAFAAPAAVLLAPGVGKWLVEHVEWLRLPGLELKLATAKATAGYTQVRIGEAAAAYAQILAGNTVVGAVPVSPRVARRFRKRNHG
jgi:hypothetical protein